MKKLILLLFFSASCLAGHPQDEQFKNDHWYVVLPDYPLVVAKCEILNHPTYTVLLKCSINANTRVIQQRYKYNAVEFVEFIKGDER